MRAFSCPTCGRLVTFENTQCLHCGQALGFDCDVRQIVALQGSRERCANHRIAGCNWLVTDDGAQCASCALTRTRPADDDRAGLDGLRRAEAAKRRLLLQLAELGLPIVSWREREGGLAFDLLSSEREPVSTGHADGVITLDLNETDSAEREARRQQLGEPYRTVLGHFRHEVGDFYFRILVPADGPRIARARELFGDETAD